MLQAFAKFGNIEGGCQGRLRGWTSGCGTHRRVLRPISEVLHAFSTVAEC